MEEVVSTNKIPPQAASSKGGFTTLERYGRSHFQRIGKKGGQATFQKYGREHMQELGRKGFQAMVAKHWLGDRQAALNRLGQLGRMAQDPAPWNGAWQYASYGELLPW